MSSITAKTIASKTGDVFTVRSAVPDDAIRLLTYIRSVAAETSFFIMQADEFDYTEDQERQWIQDHSDDPGKLLLVAEISGEIIGSLSFENGQYKRIAHRGILGISVARQWRSKGIGKALLGILIEWAEANPLIEILRLSVFANNQKAIGFYRKLGFIEEGQRVKELKLGSNEHVDDILMYRFV